MLNYCKEMSCLLSNISVQVKAAQGKVAERFLHEVRPGDFVVIRDHRRKSWKSKRWLGPFQVQLVTHTAVKVAERATWVHVDHEGGCRPLRRRSNCWRRFNASVNNAKIQFEKPLHCSCVFRRNQISAARRRQLWLHNRHTGGHCNQQNR